MCVVQKILVKRLKENQEILDAGVDSEIFRELHFENVQIELALEKLGLGKDD